MLHCSDSGIALCTPHYYVRTFIRVFQIQVVNYRLITNNKTLSANVTATLMPCPPNRYFIRRF